MKKYQDKPENVGDNGSPKRSLYDKIKGAFDKFNRAVGFYVPEPMTTEEKEQQRLREKAFGLIDHSLANGLLAAFGHVDGTHVPKDEYAEASKLFEEAGNLDLAAYNAKRAGLSERAKRLYREELGKVEKNLTTSGQYWYASKVAREAGFPDKAVKYSEKADEMLREEELRKKAKK